MSELCRFILIYGYSLTPGSIQEVKIRHPTLDWFQDLGLKW